MRFPGPVHICVFCQTIARDLVSLEASCGEFAGISSEMCLRKVAAAKDNNVKNSCLGFNFFLVSCGLLFEVIFLVTSSLQHRVCFHKQHVMDLMIFYVSRDEFPYSKGRDIR